MLPVFGDDLPESLTLDLPVAVNRAMPVWIGQPTTPQSAFATLNLPIFAPDPAASLLVTVYFQEKDGGFMRITWTGPQGAQVLSNNFYENIGMANQRSLLISPDVLVGDGTLSFQCGDSTLGIQRIKLEWLESKNGLVPADQQDLLVTASNGLTQPSQTLTGQPEPAQAAAWQNQFVVVPLDDEPVRIEEGVEFSVDLDSVPNSARIALKESGLPMGKRLIVWINQQRAGTITPSVPDLADGGFLPSTTPANTYVGWRDGSFFVPTALLKPGVNTIQFDSEDDSDGNIPATTAVTPTPLALKNIVIELSYLTPPQATTLPSPQFLLGPVEPMSPTSASTTSPETTTP
jgi:hypothetical protein